MTGNLHTTNAVDQTISVGLSPGDQITIMSESPDTDDSVDGYESLFTGTVEQHVPQTGKLTFTNASEDIGQAQFREYLANSDGVFIREA